MTNQELLKKIKQEITNYQIGLHNISRWKHKRMTNYFPAHIAKKYHINTTYLTEETIAIQIIKTGLYIADPPHGLTSTVTFLTNPEAASFNYNYNGSKSYTWNILIAIPQFLTYKDQTYFIGNLTKPINLANMLLFNPTLPPEFIYGYYCKKIMNFDITPLGCTTYEFSEELELHENTSFWGKLSLKDQEEILTTLFQERMHTMEALELANNDEPLNSIFNTSLITDAIVETRIQRKRLEPKRK